MRGFLSLLLVIVVTNTNLFAAEAGMPQLDPKYWASQAFWLILVFTVLYIAISKFYLPKIKNSIDDRENKIKDDLDDANNFNDQSEKKLKEYKEIIEQAKKEVAKISLESKSVLDKDIQFKKEKIEKEIEKEIIQAQKEIVDLKKNSIETIQVIAKDITANIIEDISGEKLSDSSIKTTVDEVSKRNIGKYL